MAARKLDYLSEPVEPTIVAQWLRSHVCMPPWLHPSYVKWYNEAKKNQEKKKEE
jgi:hypothetical protein